MSKVFTIIFLVSLSLVSLKNLNRKNKVKAQHGEDCHFFNWCASDLRCRDFRCMTKNESDAYVDQKTAPEGDICSWFHHCPDGKKCEKHRCVFGIAHIIVIQVDDLHTL